MYAFARLLDRLSFEPRRKAKEALLKAYFLETPDPDRGFALAALSGDLEFKHARPALLRGLISERTDPILFSLSYDFVGDLSETIALMWPAQPDQLTKKQGVRQNGPTAPSLTDVVETLNGISKQETPAVLCDWLDGLDETGRWALLKLMTGGLRVGVSSRLAKAAVASMGQVAPDEIEELWHGLEPPYLELFAWMEGKAERPDVKDPVPFRPVMLAHALDEEKDISSLNAGNYVAEWKWDGIRVQAASAPDEEGQYQRKLFSRSGEDISAAFPDVLETLTFNGAIDGELLIRKDGCVLPFSDLQKRLNRKAAGPKLLKQYPAAIRAYDILALEGEDLRGLNFEERRQKLTALVTSLDNPRIDLSPQVTGETWEDWTRARANPETQLPEEDAAAVEGLMLKRKESPYLPGRPKGEWFKWKRDPFVVDAVLMYAQRGHGKRSSFYSDYTFGVWKGGEDKDELVPVGKAYFGFTDDELKAIDKFVRGHTLNRFGPVREVEHTKTSGLVLEVAFEGLSRSTRHKSGLAMRFPRISRLRWDKPPAEADRIEYLESMLQGLAKGRQKKTQKA